MKSVYSSWSLYIGLVSLIAAGCSSETQPKKRDDIAADSALTADLALANRDTLLIDSIGQYRPAEGAALDTGLAGSGTTARSATQSPALPPSPSSRVSVSNRSAPAPAANPPAAARVNPAPSRAATGSPRSAASSRPRRTSGDPCDSPAPSDQQACVHSALAAADKRLNGVYRALITEMKRRKNVRPGAADPPSVERLRAAQRAWLVYRDTECRRRGRGKEGVLWARSRVQCLGEFSVRRANELGDNFSRLTAQ